MSIIPSITGKIELVYEGEQEGADHVAKILIDDAIMVQFESLFPEFQAEKEGRKHLTDIIQWFNSNHLELNYADTDKEFYKKLNSIKPLTTLIKTMFLNWMKTNKTLQRTLSFGL
jgi:magnesium chelatase subunit I